MDSENDIWGPLFLLLTDLVLWFLLGDVLDNFALAFLNVICFAAALVLLVVVIIELFQLLPVGRSGADS